METYKTTKITKKSNRVVEELSAAVMTMTFASLEGEQKADLYESPTGYYLLMAHGHWKLNDLKFMRTVHITFDGAKLGKEDVDITSRMNQLERILRKQRLAMLEQIEYHGLMYAARNLRSLLSINQI